jgi:hypothetical protein
MGPVIVQQSLVTDAGRIIGHFHGLNMPSVIAVVGGVLYGPAGEPGNHIRHTIELFEIGFHTPETATGEDRLIGLRSGNHRQQTRQKDKYSSEFHNVIPLYSMRHGFRLVTGRIAA